MKAMEQRTFVSGREKAWLMQVTANQCRSLLRSAWWKKTAPLEECCAGEEPKPDILKALLTLTPKYRVVLYLYYYEDYDTARIGKLLHISQSAVTTRLSRGRKILKERMEDII